MSFTRTRFREDRFIQGFMAGVIAAIPQFVFSLSFYVLHISKLRYLDFAAALGFAKKPKGILELVFAELIAIIMQGTLGAVFAMIVKAIFSVGIVFKGGLYGGVAWFIIFTITILYKLKPVYPIDPKTAFIVFSASVI